MWDHFLIWKRWENKIQAPRTSSTAFTAPARGIQDAWRWRRAQSCHSVGRKDGGLTPSVILEPISTYPDTSREKSFSFSLKEKRITTDETGSQHRCATRCEEICFITPWHTFQPVKWSNRTQMCSREHRHSTSHHPTFELLWWWRFKYFDSKKKQRNKQITKHTKKTQHCPQSR